MINAKLMQLAVDASNDGIVIAEHEGDDNILIYANKAFERLTGFSADEVLYQDCRLLQGDDRNQFARRAIRDALKKGQPCRQVLRNYRKDGSSFWNELSITPVFNDAEKLMYFIGIQKDVTEHVQTQQKVVELQAELAQARLEIEALKR
ncbi:PAS domain-containing protein [Pseudomonas sp. LP_7_YM]|uniref:PAS domain-containing protein n=1 Tax=Pseudomonas sp. LP_7_YM TaxID=2485137 RepID=UPI00105C9948|nr:PAS domain-containing protein [Pseudomonas sp. LP_7_YM]TDV69811.1 PAS domain S-box-containing protein [Pseudomonas sp. LP_7_YM]